MVGGLAGVVIQERRTAREACADEQQQAQITPREAVGDALHAYAAPRRRCPAGAVLEVSSIFDFVVIAVVARRNGLRDAQR